MPAVAMDQVLDPAFEGRYGVAAFNVVNDLTLEAVLSAAAELDSPLIVQTSLKTVRSIGATVLYKLFRAMADECPIPVTLHLDHCPDRAWVTTCLETRLELGALRRLAPRGRREHRARPPRSSQEARRFGALVEGEIESVRGVEDDVGSDDDSLVHPVLVSERVHREDRRLLVRACDRHGARAVRAQAAPDARARVRDRRAAADPAGAARRHGPDDRAVPRPDRARLRQGQHLDRAQDRLRRRAPRVPRREPERSRTRRR